MHTKFCKNCGAPVDEGQAFCSECGLEISSHKAPGKARNIKSALTEVGFSIINPLALIALFLFPWYITSPDTGRLLAVKSGDSLAEVMHMYFFGGSKLGVTMLSVSTAAFIFLCLLIAVIAWLVSGVIAITKKANPYRVIAYVFSILFYLAVFASQIFWPTIMPWLCYGQDFTSATICFQLESNPAFNLTHWGAALFILLVIVEAIIRKRIASQNKAGAVVEID